MQNTGGTPCDTPLPINSVVSLENENNTQSNNKNEHNIIVFPPPTLLAELSEEENKYEGIRFCEPCVSYFPK
jgi:hypothetical protein